MHGSVLANAAAVLATSASEGFVTSGVTAVQQRQRCGRLGGSVTTSGKQQWLALVCRANAAGAEDSSGATDFDASLRAALKEMLEKQNQEWVQELGQMLREEWGQMLREELASIHASLEEQSELLEHMDTMLGGMLQRNARKHAEEEAGESYCEQLLQFARSIPDLSYFFPAEVLSGPGTLCYSECTQERWVLAQLATRTLVEQRVPERLLRCVEAKIQHQESEGSTGASHSTDRDGALSQSLVRLRNVLSMDKPEQAEELLCDDGPGLMCLLAAAHPTLYLDEKNLAIMLPPNTLEFDLRGQIDVSSNGSSVYIDVGEVRSALQYKKAVELLGLRLGGLTWLATTCMPHPKPAIRLIGRSFVARGGLEPEERSCIEDEQRELAADRWGYSLYLHMS